MKYQKIFSLLLLFFFLSSFSEAFSGGDKELPKSSTNHSTILIDQVKTMIKYPDFARENKISGFVNLSFSYNNDGSFKVNEINYSNLELSEYVVEELKNLKVCPWGKSPEKEYIIRFNFKIL